MKYVSLIRVDRHALSLRILALLISLIPLLIVRAGTTGIVTTPVSPKLLSPGSPSQTAGEIATLTPELKWEQVFDAQLYSAHVRRFPFTENDVVFRDESVSVPHVTVPPGHLVDGEKYRWYVRAFNKAGWSDKSQVLYFAVSLPVTKDAAPSPIAPGTPGIPGSVISTACPTFRWKPVPGATKYGLYVRRQPYGNGRVVYVNESITESSFLLPKGHLSNGQTYRWNVRSLTKEGWSTHSQRLYFVVKASEEKSADRINQRKGQITGQSEFRNNGLTSGPPIYHSLPNDVIVEGELSHLNPSLVSLSPLQIQLVQREMPPSIPIRPGQEAPPLPSSTSSSVLPTPRPESQGMKMPPTAPFSAKLPVTTSLPSGQRREAQVSGTVATAAEVRPAASTSPNLQKAQIASPSVTQAPSQSQAPLHRVANQIPPPSAGSMVQMQFDSIELRDLIKFVSNIMGKNFIFDDTVVKGKVTILSPKSLSRDEVFRVFESVLNYYGFTVVTSPEAFKIVKSSDAKAHAIESLDREKLLTIAPEEKTATLIHPLDYLDSNTMVGILRPLMAKDAYLVSVPTTNSLIMIDTSANLQRLKKLVAELDIPVSKQLSSIEVYNVQHTTAADLAKTLQALLAEGKKAATPKEKIFITSYAPTNSLLVSAPPEDLKEIKRIVEGIDTIRPQVLVEAAIIEVSLTKGSSIGVDWIAGGTTDSGKGAIGGVFNPGAPIVGLAGAIAKKDPLAITAAASNLSGFNVGIVGGTIELNGQSFPSIGAFIRAIATKDSVNILSTPQILTMNNEEAEIVVGENRPYLTSSRLDSAGNPINTFDYRDVGIKLKVKPYINKDGLVYLTLYQEVTKVTEATVGSGTSTQPAPTTLKRSTKTTVGVKDSQTIVISGLIRDDSERTSSGIPILSSIPVLGALFGVQTRTVDKTNLLVFITPRIIYSSEKIEEISQQLKEEQEKLVKQQKASKKE